MLAVVQGDMGENVAVLAPVHTFFIGLRSFFRCSLECSFNTSPYIPPLIIVPFFAVVNSGS